MGLLSFLFGGKREGVKPPLKRDPGADMIRVATPPKATKAKDAKAREAKGPVLKEAPAPVAEVVALTPAPKPTLKQAPGSAQVKLRLQLAAATRAGDLEAAYEAARALEDIQRLAGRRVGARVWREQAERIYAEM